MKANNTWQYLQAQSCHHAVYKKSIPCSEAIRKERVRSERENLQHKLGNLESWLVNTSYRA